MKFKNLPIQRKLRTIILLTSTPVLLLAGGIFVSYQWESDQQEMARYLATLAEVTAENSTAALAFENEGDAQNVLAALRVERHIVAGALYDQEGTLFTTYPAGRLANQFPKASTDRQPRFTAADVSIFRPVVEGGTPLGTIYLQSDLSALYRKMRINAGIGFLIVVVSWLLAYTISAALQRRISQPILALAATARAVSERKDYSVRARKEGEDELGLLTDAFNQMLDQIHEQDSALRESEARKGAILDSALDGIISIDSRGRVIEFNPAAQRLFGCTRDQALGQELAELVIPPARREDYHRGLAKYLASGDSQVLGHRVELAARRADGTEFPAELSITRIPGQEPAMFTGFVRDITERKKAEEEILRLNAGLEQRVQERTSQLEAANHELEAFSYSVSHDLRAPLRAISGFAQLLSSKHKGNLDAETDQWLGIILKGTEKMGRLIDELLNFSRLGRQELRDSAVDMDALAREVAEDLSGPQGQQVIRFDLPLPQAQGDEGLLRQVWVNLLANALKFSRQRVLPVIRVGGRSESDENTYYVKDNGVGFDPKYARNLFGVFQRLHSEEEFEGTGVGLALVHRIISRHGGRVWAEAQPNAGATFYFTLPHEQGEREKNA